MALSVHKKIGHPEACWKLHPGGIGPKPTRMCGRIQQAAHVCQVHKPVSYGTVRHALVEFPQFLTLTRKGASIARTMAYGLARRALTGICERRRFAVRRFKLDYFLQRRSAPAHELECLT